MAAPTATLDEARVWVQQFVQWYNERHRHRGIKYAHLLKFEGRSWRLREAEARVAKREDRV